MCIFISRSVSQLIMKYLTEVTVWESPIQNHTYIINDVDWLVGYIKQGTTEEIIFSKPMKSWSKSYRKFVEYKGVRKT